VISYSFWRNQMKGDAAAIGKSIEIGNGSIEVAGVLAPEFQFQPYEFDVYLPIAIRRHRPELEARKSPGPDRHGELARRDRDRSRAQRYAHHHGSPGARISRVQTRMRAPRLPPLPIA